MFVEIFPDPLSPIFLSVIRPMFKNMLDFTFKVWGFEPPQGSEATGVFYNQPYFSRNYIEAALTPLSPPVRDRLVAQIVNPFGRTERGIRTEFSPIFLRMVLRLLRSMGDIPEHMPGLIADYRAAVAEMNGRPLDAVSDGEIVAYIHDLVLVTASRLLNYDFLMIALIRLTYQALTSLLERYFGEETEEIRSKLISGVTGNVTMETNKRIWDLARVAKASPAVRDALQRYGDRELKAQLEQTPEGREFLDALQHFLSEYGHREIRMDILYPTWGEDATPVLSFIRGYLSADEAQSPHRQQARLVAQRQELTQAVTERLKQDLRGRVLITPIFRWVLSMTQTHTRERDTMHFELTRLFPAFRRLLLELGRRWRERGLIDERDDIFFLTLEELDEIAAAPRSMQVTVQARRAEFEANKHRPWPDIVRGTEEIYSAASAGTAPEAAAEGQLRGVAGSPGLVTGVARVIRAPEEFDRFHNGEILVAPLTNPVWTPLFAMAGGLVTEVGGILSHGAIVAREYGIPAVMSVAGATKQVRDGQRITVDGNKGLVYMAEEGAV
jgi:phosphohistidine swiveling domain-containing protein